MNTRRVAIVSLLTNLALIFVVEGILKDRNACIAERDHMLAQRVAVLEVEQFITGRQPWRNTAELRGYAELIVDSATEFKLPPKLVARVAIAESALNHRAVGDGGKSHGILQLQEFWVKEIPFLRNKQDLYRAHLNIRAGAWVLRHYADLCGEDHMSYLACFNGGPKPNAQARAYAARVAGGA